MIFLISTTTDPYYNIATEELLFTHHSEDFFFLYQDDSAVICGKHQNALAEINHQYITEHRIPVIRRLSGGGTVYHDLGNLNFCFIVNVEEGKQIDFKRHTIPMIQALEKEGIKAELGIRNDILIDGKKISGNAEHVRKNRVLHHGTLLFESNLTKLKESIRGDFSKFTDKAVKSTRSEVANIRTFLKNELLFSDFLNSISSAVASTNQLIPFQLTANDDSIITSLIRDKYNTWEWNFGYSPKYQYVNELWNEGHQYYISIIVANGIITTANFLENSVPNSTISKKLIGIKHEIRMLQECTFLPLNQKEIHILFFNHK